MKLHRCAPVQDFAVRLPGSNHMKAAELSAEKHDRLPAG